MHERVSMCRYDDMAMREKVSCVGKRDLKGAK